MSNTVFTYSDRDSTTSPDTILTSASYGNNTSTLTGVQIGTIVTSLGIQCFFNCTNLTSVTFDAESQVTSLGDDCFNSCSGLTTITIPSSISSLPIGCFLNCSGFTSFTIPSTVTSLGDYCFNSCSRLTTITIPSTISSLPNNCFKNCRGFTSFTIPSTVTSLGDECFSQCSGLTTITIPSSISSLPIGCFYGCGFTSFTIPSTVTSLGDYCFTQCSGLTTITIPSSISSLPNNCFTQCSGLTTITIPSSVTSIGFVCFYNCISLRSFTFDNQNSLTSVGTNTFLNDPAMAVTYYNTANEESLNTASTSLKSQFPPDSTFVYNANPSCFNKGTHILTEQGYIKIEDLKKGDLVKTYLHGFKKITRIGYGFGKNNNANKLLNLHEWKGIFEEPLIISGGHSILVDDLGDLKEENEKWFHGGTYKIEDKYLLLATVSNDFKEIKDGSEFEYYHLVLENEDKKGQYGIWANDVLTESATQEWFENECLREL